MLKTGMILGERYEIVSKIGTGGMADVYKAKDHKLNRFVAVKILKPEFREDTNFIGKFRSEAQAAAGLTHPNIVNVFDVGEDQGMHYIVMELIEGITLKDYINKKGRLSIKETTSIAIQVSMGLEAAHSHGIIHRDVKPQNIMISTDGKVKVTDFGIARAASSNTISSNVMGSVHYSSPEQVRGGYSDEKSDIYSLGITLYEMVTGKVPFDGDTTVAIAIKHLQEEMVPPTIYTPELPYSLEQIINKCTQKSVDRRYQKMEDVIADLKHSLVDPDGDFVKLVPVDDAAKTLILSDKDLNEIKSNTGKVTRKVKQTETIARMLDEDDELDYEDDDYEFEEKEKKSRKKASRAKKKKSHNNQAMIKIAGLAAGILILAGAGYYIGVKSGIFDKKDKGTENVVTPDNLDEGMVEVPNMVGMTEEDAIAEVQSRHLGVKFAGEEFSDLEKGKVSWQSEEAGASIQEYSTISYKISKGSESLKMPELKDTVYDEATTLNQFLDEGISVKILRKYDDYAEEDVILSTDPEAGETIASGDTVTITISDNDAYYSELPEEVFYPEVKAETLEDSQETPQETSEAQDQAAENTETENTETDTTDTADGAAVESQANGNNELNTAEQSSAGSWVCTQTLNYPEDYNNGPLRLELLQEVNGELKATTLVEDAYLEFPYKLNIEGASGVTDGDIRISELVDGSYKELGYYPVVFEEKQ